MWRVSSLRGKPGRQSSRICRSARPQQIDRLFDTFTEFETVEKYAYRATLEEVRENEYNLNIPRYVDTFEPEPEMDIPAVQREIEDLERQLTETREEMAGYLRELGLREEG